MSKYVAAVLVLFAVCVATGVANEERFWPGYPYQPGTHGGVNLMTGCPMYCRSQASYCWGPCSAVYSSFQCRTCMQYRATTSMWNGCGMCFPGFRPLGPHVPPFYPPTYPHVNPFGHPPFGHKK